MAAVVLAALLAAGSTTAATADPGTARTGVHLTSPNGKAFGRTLGEWLEVFWVHALPIPTADSPLVGNGDMCPVVDGVLVYYGLDEELCTVSEGTGVLIVSTVAVECDTNDSGEFKAGPDLKSLLACARMHRQHFSDEVLRVDGTRVARLGEFMTETGRFAYEYPEDNPFDARPGPAMGAAVGTVVMLDQLDPGEHMVTSSLTEIETGERLVGRMRIVVAER